jgi:hypothetical protein
VKAALLTSAFIITGCGKLLPSGDAGDAAAEAAFDASADTSPDVSTWHCGWDFDASTAAWPGPKVVTCDDATKAACQAWGQSLVQAGTVYTYCDDVDKVHHCVLDNICTSSKNGLLCSCDNIGCPNGANQVCVSDTPSSPKKCVPPCSQ